MRRDLLDSKNVPESPLIAAVALLVVVLILAGVI